MNQSVVDGIYWRLMMLRPDAYWGQALSPEDEETTRAQIDRLLADRWNPDEIVSALRWVENINPDVDENTALRKMGAVHQRVQARLRAV